MPRLRLLASRLRGLLSRRDPDGEFNAEMREHLDLLIRRYIGQGMSPDEAAHAARRQFGNTALLSENRRRMQSVPAVEMAARDVRYALRQLLLHPLFTLVA